MDWLATLFESGRIADLIISGLLLEAGALAFLRHRLAYGPPLIEWLLLLLSGAGLLWALGLALRGAHWTWLALALLVALGGHMAHLMVVWTARPNV